MPRIARVLSAAQVKDLSKKIGEHPVGGEPGLVLRVSASSSDGTTASWMLRKQGAGAFRLGLGAYPAVSLRQARELAHAALIKAKAGINPVEERRTNIQRAKEASSRQSELTIGDLFEEFYDWKEARGDWKRAGEARRRAELRFRKNILPLGANIVVATATPDQIADVFRPFWAEKRSTADKLLPDLKAFFTWATTVRKIRSPELVNPAQKAQIAPLLPSEKLRKPLEHYPFLLPEQMPSFMKQLLSVDSDAARCTALAILTCSRSLNAREMEWSEIDLENELWTVAADKMKVTANGQHIIPLSRQAMEILKRQSEQREFLGCPYVFPGRDGLKGLSNSTLNKVIRTLHNQEVLAGREGWIDREQSKLAGHPVIAVQHAVARASFETWAQSERKDPRTIALCLHHNVDTALQSAYDRDSSLSLKRILLQEWADFLLK